MIFVAKGFDNNGQNVCQIVSMVKKKKEKVLLRKNSASLRSDLFINVGSHGFF